jgi:hypothetical protein
VPFVNIALWNIKKYSYLLIIKRLIVAWCSDGHVDDDIDYSDDYDDDELVVSYGGGEPCQPC